MYVVGNVAVRRYDSRKTEEKPMAWTTPVLVEICVGLEINGYLRADSNPFLTAWPIFMFGRLW
jgi:coenzyme PQQ precursor peptide PqqA